jgi:hypothetical protein
MQKRAIDLSISLKCIFVVTLSNLINFFVECVKINFISRVGIGSFIMHSYLSAKLIDCHGSFNYPCGWSGGGLTTPWPPAVARPPHGF